MDSTPRIIQSELSPSLVHMDILLFTKKKQKKTTWLTPDTFILDATYSENANAARATNTSIPWTVRLSWLENAH